ncbi:MAG: hypothetical protein M1833_006251 [Piccolia ochrophora]|nr:MAG: hypothetical protein M1833_006251 [Piccolia ochrophora]
MSLAQDSSRKRKHPWSSDPTSQRSAESGRARKRAKTRDARHVAVQTTDKAFKNGELAVDKYVKARQFEIRALEASMRGSKKTLATRAHQALPRDMRRRNASHNVKRLPKRSRARANKEMVEDKTPTVTARRRKPQSTRARLRQETAKKLDRLAARTRRKKFGEDLHPLPQALKPRKARVKQLVKTKANELALPPLPAAKFRQRQRQKTWLPTHLFHAKRARMTIPKEPLWRFAIPLTPTEKRYRPTHRASLTRGAVAWDTTFNATIGLDGKVQQVIELLEILMSGPHLPSEDSSSRRMTKWREGKRFWDGWLFSRHAKPRHPIAPVTIILCATSNEDEERKRHSSERRKAFLRVHPSAFMLLWTEIYAIIRIVRLEVVVRDLRFEIGSIEIVGPASTEALRAALEPVGGGEDGPERTWKNLCGLNNPSCLPPNTLLGFDVSDPRLRYPPRPSSYVTTEESHSDLVDILSAWPPDLTQNAPSLFDRQARVTASHNLPSRKSIDRRKGLALPGQYPEPWATDPEIPILLLASSMSPTGQGKWTLLAPWKCIPPIWYTLMHYPLSSGGRISFGGLQENRQVAFEAGLAWFPGDFPGTDAGWEWELRERRQRKATWQSRPKAKRIEWSSVDLGRGKKGEIGLGWNCDWETLLTINGEATPNHENVNGDEAPQNTTSTSQPLKSAHETTHKGPVVHLPSPLATQLLNGSLDPSFHAILIPLNNALVTVKVTLIGRGNPTACARLYRLPSTDQTLRQKWLDLLHPPRTSSIFRTSSAAHTSSKPGKCSFPPPLPKNATPVDRRRYLASSLLTQPDYAPHRADSDEYPIVPGNEDLVGFLTTGNFSLREGRGVGIGCLLLRKFLGKHGGASDEEEEKRLCIVREAGFALGRLAKWEIV